MDIEREPEALFPFPFPFGPKYHVSSPAVAKWRITAQGRELTYDEKKLYGKEVLAAVNAANKALLRREVPTLRTNCVSGCTSNKAKDILAAVRRAARGG